MTRWVGRSSVAVVAAAVGIAVFPATAGAVSPSATAQAGGKAVNLKITETIRGKLADAYWNQYYKPYHPRASRTKVDGPKRVYYGKIKGATAGKDVYWAVGSIGIKGDPISYQDGPHVWRKRGSGAWAYRGDTGGCLAKVPKALLKIWHLPTCS
ncbi:hypothetical protein Sme01_70800 [Sphaerisporangium melleum]|uniref:Secreted protein n=1 Tax=Sphaerisporangium melleum TaxID=321316 RepID=A0A917RLH2_9ACTN|nr:hypothetical protein [Sphaerisporangium melleum]GGL13991.1 hypothetical protein GCM10007964_64990 [Sphaerisporangium melleum]GII74604.1 hypothetical protein Sme01_70800 [Sphaerisporangium melleum]